jgi:hypothetical protein
VGTWNPEITRTDWFVIAEAYVDEWRPLAILTPRGLGVPVFEYPERAQAFIEVNWESLGPGWEPKWLHKRDLANVLQRLADEGDTKLVLFNFPPVRAAPDTFIPEVVVADIRRFIEVLRN